MKHEWETMKNEEEIEKLIKTMKAYENRWKTNDKLRKTKKTMKN